MTSKIVVITGAAGALGSAVARHLKADGFRLALVDTPHAVERLGALQAELGPSAGAFTGDIAAPASWDAILPKIESDLGGLPTHAALIAGGWQGGTPLHAETDDKVWRAMITSNLDTVHVTLRAVLPGMVARKSGSIVVIGSRAVVRPWTSAGASAYAAAKAGAVALVEAVAAEVLASHVRVNAILPSTMDTPANRRAMPDVDPATWVTTESAAGVVGFLLGDAARDISGAAIPVYGRA
jgi:NAD(P)-dependent dehydrogenase (short-subunit alcohol dehydrogenase family)